jgi:hypothetical protein
MRDWTLLELAFIGSTWYTTMRCDPTGEEVTGPTTLEGSKAEVLERIAQSGCKLGRYASSTKVMSERRSNNSNIEENRRKSQERISIVSDYGAFMERTSSEPLSIWDVKCLPHKKQSIFDAICVEIVRETNQTRIEALKNGALFLAHFQDGIGDQPISMNFGIDLPPEPLNAKDIQAFAAAIIATDLDEQFDKYISLLEQNAAEIHSMWVAAEQLGRQMPDEKKREVFG